MNPELILRIRSTFEQRFGKPPDVVIYAPGRINLIGEHTDYNHGFVMPGAVSQGMAFALARSSDESHRWFAADRAEALELRGTDWQRTGDWQDFVFGAWKYFQEISGKPLGCFSCVFGSDLPHGAGLSSSSALTCGILLGLQQLASTEHAYKYLALLAHRIEREFVGLQGGIMDQFACFLAKKNHFMVIDCRDRAYRYVASPENLNILLVNTNVKHKLIESDYNRRTEECKQAVQILAKNSEIQSLRDATLELIAAHQDELGDVLTRRARYVVAENRRVHRVVEALQQGDLNSTGDLLQASHAGLRDDYEVSCSELDFLQERLSALPGVYGARMMGGGFGGCVICIAEALPGKEDFDVVSRDYREQFSLEPTLIRVMLSAGARVVG